MAGMRRDPGREWRSAYRRWRRESRIVLCRQTRGTWRRDRRLRALRAAAELFVARRCSRTHCISLEAWSLPDYSARLLGKRCANFAADLFKCRARIGYDASQAIEKMNHTW